MSLLTLVAGGQLLPAVRDPRRRRGADALVRALRDGRPKGARQRAESRDRVIVVGDGDEGALVRSELEANPERPAVVVGAFDTASMIGAGHAAPAGAGDRRPRSAR